MSLLVPCCKRWPRYHTLILLLLLLGYRGSLPAGGQTKEEMPFFRLQGIIACLLQSHTSPALPFVVATRVVELEDFLGFRLLTPTPAVLKSRLRLQQFWKADSDSSSFKKPTPTPDSDSTTLVATHTVILAEKWQPITVPEGVLSPSKCRVLVTLIHCCLKPFFSFNLEI